MFEDTIESLLEHLIADKAGVIRPAFTRMFELAMRPKRERCLGADHDERSDDRRGCANEILRKASSHFAMVKLPRIFWPRLKR